MVMMIMSLVLLAFGTMAVAQSTTVPPVGVTMSGWNASTIIGQGFTVGGDGKGTVTTLADGVFKTTINANVAANSQGTCKIDCTYTLQTLNLSADLTAGAKVINQGFGTQDKPVVSVAGTSANWMTSASIIQQATQVPTNNPTAPSASPGKP